MTKPFGTITTNNNIIYSHYDPAKFVGRRWLVDEVARFRDSRDGRLLLIIGEPGSGKSTFMAFLATIWNCPLHYIRVDNIRGVAGVDPRSFLVSIGDQLYQKYGPDIFFKDEIGSTVVTSGLTKDKAEVIGRFIDELYTLPFLPPPKRDVSINAGIAIGESKVIGERIGKMVDVTHALDETTLLHVAVLNPVQKVKELYPDEKVVILIDALDESLKHLGTQVLDVIPREADSDFPSNLRLVMTSRPGNHLASFRRKDQFRLDDEENGNKTRTLQDIRQYIDNKLAAKPLATAIATWPEAERKAYVEEIAIRSDGNFLYLHHFFSELTAAVEQENTDLHQIGVPRGLDEIYQVFAVEKIRRLVDEFVVDKRNFDTIRFSVEGIITDELVNQWQKLEGVQQIEVDAQNVTVTVVDSTKVQHKFLRPALKAGVDIDDDNMEIQEGATLIYNWDWEEKYCPILGILAVSHEPLNREQLARFAKVDVIYVDTIVAQLKQFLRVEIAEQEVSYRLFHQSFSEYLLDSSRNSDYPLNSKFYHGMIADFYLDERKHWNNVDWTQVFENYPYHHLISHLIAGDRKNEIYSTLLSGKGLSDKGQTERGGKKNPP